MALLAQTGVPDDTLTDRQDAVAASPADVVAPHLFVVLEGSRPAAGSSRHLLSNVDEVRIGRAATRAATRSSVDGRRTLFIGIPDVRISAAHASLYRAGDDLVLTDLGSRNGIIVDGRRIEGRTVLADGALFALGHTMFRFRSAVPTPLVAPSDWDVSSVDDDCLLKTVDPLLADRVAMLSRIARSKSPVLLLGETGTGKEVLARGIHRQCGRDGSFVAVNCGALPATLLEAQLFGHVRGAFSGALTSAPGLLRSADRGTLFLDEIGDLPEPSQAALLRAIQEQEVLPVGAVQPIAVDFRVVAATHRSLGELVALGKFRSDLYARIAGFSFVVPPLRARREDIGLMTAALARRFPVRIAPDAARALLGHDWPLNVRELHHALEVAATLSRTGTIDIGHLRKGAPSMAAVEAPRVVAATVNPVRERLVASLQRHSGNVSEVARELGKARTQVQRWMKRFALDARHFR